MRKGHVILPKESGLFPEDFDLIDENTNALSEGDCRYYEDFRDCYKKLRICFFELSTGQTGLDRFCKKHIKFALGAKKSFLEEDDHYKRIVELTAKDILYLKLTEKYHEEYQGDV